MATLVGRPPKAAVPAPPPVLVPVVPLKMALLEIADTPVEEMTIQRFVDVAAAELDAAFAGERPKAEVLRKLLAVLTKSGWTGQESDIVALLDGYEARQRVTTSAAPPRSAQATAASAAPTSVTGAKDQAGNLEAERASPSNPSSAPDLGSARKLEGGVSAIGGVTSSDAAALAPTALPDSAVTPNVSEPVFAEGGQARSTPRITPAGAATLLTTPSEDPSRGSIGQTEPALPIDGTPIITPSKSDAAHDQRPGSLEPRPHETPSDRHLVASPPDLAFASTRITRPEQPRGDGQAGDALRPPSPYERRFPRPRPGLFADDGDHDAENTKPKP